jgi:hypothetical protein
MVACTICSRLTGPTPTFGVTARSSPILIGQSTNKHRGESFPNAQEGDRAWRDGGWGDGFG